MMKLTLAFIMLLTGLVAGASAEEAHVVVRGTDGLVAVPFRVENRSGAGMTCGAAIAHWYSMPVGQAPTGVAVTATLWSDPKTGTVFLLNPSEDRMPVLDLWCGRTGSDVSTGFRILLGRRAGTAEPAIALACGPGRDKALDCAPSTGP